MANEAKARTEGQEERPLRVGLDIGSTTVKAVVLDATDRLEDAVFADYRRHHANVRATVAGLLKDIHARLEEDGRGDAPIRLAITGSGGLALADNMHVPFIQEVIAETKAINRQYPQADVIIELGGEDAKITYLKPTPEQRMNGSCAGGTGAFIDQMATLLGTDAAGLNDMAREHTTLYPIASRCGVFAKTDLQPLINDGAAKPDLAASIFQAVATQTIAGLSSGRPVRGTVVFLGGPLFFMSELREAFHRILEGKVKDYIVPEDAHLYVAYGAALLAGTEEGEEIGEDSEDETAAQRKAERERTVTCADVLRTLDELKNLPSDTPTMRPLFLDEAEKAEFDERHHRQQVKVGDLTGAHGPHFLGIDAGSTTIKATLVNDDREIVWSSYGTNEGSPLLAAANIVRKIQEALPEGAFIARSCATGYGEGLITTGLHLDEGVVETMAHYRGAEMVSPGVTSVIDIGGQDMKYLAVADGVIESIAVNEACSSGCGSFLQTFSQSMGLTIQEFTQAALRSKAPVDLGSRCTVFMNSSVKQAQKEGASIDDIAAGLCYSVVRNALYKVIKLRDSGELGDTVVVQGGTFLNDAVLRAFELLTERKVTRPNIAGLMGAYGAALTARMHYEDGGESSILRGEQLDNLSMTTERDVCKLCQNHCKLTITTFQDGSKFVTGNRCERGGDRTKQRSDRPNLYDYKYKRAFAYRRLTEKAATRGDIGIPRVLNMYENYPFWFTLLTQLGFRVMISGRSSHELFETGIESIASENICYPAKLVHGHIKWLLDKGIKTIFYPCVSYEENLVDGADNHYNCPVVANYPVVIGANMAELREPGIRYMRPYFNLADHDLMVDRIVEEFAWANVTREEAETAVKAAYAEDKVFKHDVQQEGLRALAYMKEHDVRGIVLAGRPYHVDPEINHGIPETICALGMAVLSEDSICELEPGQQLDLTDFIAQNDADAAKGRRVLHRSGVSAGRGGRPAPRAGGAAAKAPAAGRPAGPAAAKAAPGKAGADTSAKAAASTAGRPSAANAAAGAASTATKAPVAHTALKASSLTDATSAEAQRAAVAADAAKVAHADIAEALAVGRVKRPHATGRDAEGFRHTDRRPMPAVARPGMPAGAASAVGAGKTARPAATRTAGAAPKAAASKAAVAAKGSDNPIAKAVKAGKRFVITAGKPSKKLPLRVMNQWAYHSRLYAAARFVASYPGLELVQLNSFGCGLDAITTDQVQEILADKADVYTLLKIDEVSNLGAAKIRLRSLKAAVEERERNARIQAAKEAEANAEKTERAEKARQAREQLDAARAELAKAQAAVDAAEGRVRAFDAPAAPASKGFRKTGAARPAGRDNLDADFVSHPYRPADPNAAPATKTMARPGASAAAAQGASAKAPARRKASAHNASTQSKYANKIPFGKSMKKDYTILCPQMSPIHLSLVEAVLRSGGYNFVLLEKASRADVECGLKYVNNDACFPAIMVVGQMVNALVEGRYDPDRTALAITQTGGMCRATNYFGLIRKALVDAGFPQVPVIALSTQGFEDNPGFTPTPTMVHRAVKALCLGDLLLKCLMRTRPYEKEKGAADALYRKWDATVRETIEHHGFTKTGAREFGHGYMTYGQIARRIVRTFDALPLRDIPRKPRVGVVGEILVKYHPDANNHVVDVIESQGCEAVVPGIMEFMTTHIYTRDWEEHYLGKGHKKNINAVLRWAVEEYEKPIRKAIALSNGKFQQDLPMPELAKKAAEVTSLGVQAGEGWLLTAEILELIETGAPNVVCAQPFACLPNHVTGRGMFHEIRRQHPEANIVSIDYDPGASEANQLNRIKLMIAAAKEREAEARAKDAMGQAS